MTRLPTVFVSHGSPMEALDAGSAGRAWRALADTLPRPRAIVIVSAHFSAPYPVVGTAAQYDTIHDFYGFPPELYQLRYDAPGDPALAMHIVETLQAQNWPVRVHPSRGLDHGAWVPLRYMYPEVDIPVVNVSIDEHQDPSYHYRLGQALTAALDDDVLLIGSGSLTHNLSDFRRQTGAAPAYVTAFQRWIQERLRAGDIAALLDYRQQAPDSVRAHPSDEHLLPLFVALGAAEGAGDNVKVHFSEIAYQVLAMDLYSFSRQAA
ncbi:4,5-DOPA dioxygenase extradiol [Pseudomonas duriflava]|uniref:4,5-DOPA dioxygenase extradiol n=1 Tax=Pseudomonas duriflava TaxID=459528 RepID=A0A562QFX2_9PSED|nr:class III extradiol ring-cleavage dioxygenase [Pseudomonas duriflava]TWI55593.1 4,5-DOPA dioxygenase extradiol [Pseudomonas duriflava]